ncbi:MAG: DNA recombination protein RmuC [Alphaproteobacteria bacterium]|jgi:DNA recombination protein RmuC|nr:DNA recombination protein RmuC [Alphaproteobacteria bacterium]
MAHMDIVILALLILVAAIAAFATFSILRLRGRAGEAETLRGELARLTEVFATGQRDMEERLKAEQRALGERMHEREAALNKTLAEGLQSATKKTLETMSKVEVRLAVIDKAQANIADLSSQVVSLQDILSNKQARGAFGEIQLNDLVRQVLPPSAFRFQAQLSNGRRADCLLELPNPPGAIAIDAKFPLESYHALQAADDDAAKKAAGRGFRDAMQGHIKDISERYILAGETADAALMFLPSEAVYAELHANFPATVEASYRARVFIVSPTTLWATLNTVRAILKDVRMKEQAGLIQKEVQALLGDVVRLDDRVGKLQRHFEQAGDDMRQIRISTDKVGKRAERIESVQLEDGEEGAGADSAIAAPLGSTGED